MTKPTFGSLFAGVGGIDLGFEAAGWEGKFQVEWDAHCQQTLAYHWPDVPRWGDVSDVNGADLPLVDLITFGSPCQDLSTAGRRAGLVEGSRSNLFFEATRIIKEMRDASGNTFPRWALWENVPGAFSSNQGADFGAVLDEMANLGAVAIEWHCLDAQFFGVPQRRRRVFVLACFDLGISKRGRQQVLPVPEGRRGDSATRRKARQDAARTTQDRPTGPSRQDAKGWDGRGTGLIGGLNAVDYKWVQNQQVDDNKLILEFAPEEGEPSVYVKGRRAHTDDDYETWDEREVAPTLNQGDNVSEGRSTVLIIDGTRTDDVRVYEEPVQTMIGRWGTSGGNVPYLAIEAPLPVLMRQREGKAGGGKGPLLSTDLSPSLVGSNELVLFAPAAEEDICDLCSEQVTYCSCWRCMTCEQLFHEDVEATEDEDGESSCLPCSRRIAIPIDDVRDIKKHQTGLGIGDVGDPMYTLDTMSHAGVAYSVTDTVYPIQDGREIEKHQNGLGIGEPGDPMYTLDQTGGQAVAQEVIAFEPGALARGLSGDRWSADVTPTLRADMGDNHPAVSYSIGTTRTFQLDALSSNSMKSPNPISGSKEVDTSPTLDTWRPDPSLNQGGLAIVHAVDPDQENQMTLPISHAALRGGGLALTPSPDGQGGESIRHPGFGIGEDGDPMYSLTTTPPAVATTETEFMTTDGNSERTIAFGVDGYNQTMSDGVYHTIDARTAKGDDLVAVEKKPTEQPIPKLVVRRLTPVECERLMGWPDNHTLYRSDGKENKDGARYKMCGNGVASPVAEWIARNILKAQEKMDAEREPQ